ncbi:carboxypeptidase Q [Pelobates cultripes]|uniref:Carboxypeptidase Q n=1 Tax=Pelobates cultripes TaxID=61616 RepID=A0AAD1S205_PELCU|nr:carboxypeptidase Q [Pelobates cultripes]
MAAAHSGAEDSARGPSLPPNRAKATNTAHPKTYHRRRSTKRDQHGLLTWDGRARWLNQTAGEVGARASGSGFPGKPSPWCHKPNGAGLCHPPDEPVVMGGGHRLQACGWCRVRCRNTLLKGLTRSRGGISAEVIVVSSFTELHSRAKEAKGKIVVYNQPFVSYGETVQYRAFGASEAAKVGAVASLIRSITPFSIYSPHTGWQDYQKDVPKIPTACITIEDAEMFARMASRGEKIVVQLKMGAVNHPDADSFNTVAEIVGSKYPEQVVIVSGHLDSWDVGQGAMDDGGGAFISWEALSLIKDLGLQPKRTVRLVLWTGEEQGGVGAGQYYERHKGDISNMDLVMESDIGTFMPTGMQFSGSNEARAIMTEIMQLLKPINITNLYDNAEGTDIRYWMQAGVPGASLIDDIEKYFWFHHSQGDTMTVQNPIWMNLCAAVWTVVSYVVADMEEMLPR